MLTADAVPGTDAQRSFRAGNSDSMEDGSSRACVPEDGGAHAGAAAGTAVKRSVSITTLPREQELLLPQQQVQLDPNMFFQLLQQGVQQLVLEQMKAARHSSFPNATLGNVEIGGGGDICLTPTAPATTPLAPPMEHGAGEVAAGAEALATPSPRAPQNGACNRLHPL